MRMSVGCDVRTAADRHAASAAAGARAACCSSRRRERIDTRASITPCDNFRSPVTNGSRHGLIWPRVLFAIVAALLVVPLASSWRQPGVPWLVHALVATIFVVTAFRPSLGLLCFAGLFPLVPAIGVLTATPWCT